MLARLLSAALAGCAVLFTASTAFAYYSKDSYEADVTFTGIVEIAGDTPDFLLLPSYISRQLLYLAGPVQAASRKAAAKNDAKIDVLERYRDSKTGEDSVAFFCMAKEAAERGSVFLYAGHSRVGLLDLKYMGDQIGAPIKMNAGQYQIFGFFGCSSYSYYNLSYFRSEGLDERS